MMRLDYMPIEDVHPLGAAIKGPYRIAPALLKDWAKAFRSAWAERFGKIMPLDDLCMLPVNVSVVDGTREYRMRIHHEPDSQLPFRLRFYDTIKMRMGPVDGPDGRTGYFATQHEALAEVVRWLLAGKWPDANT